MTSRERELIRSASAKSFALSFRWVDYFLLIAVASAVSVSIVHLLMAADMRVKVIAALCSFVSAGSAFVLCRLLVPFALNISYADTLRLRLPLYSWLLVVLGCVAASDPVLRLYTREGLFMVQVTLILVAWALTISFYRTGRYVSLAIAYLCAGVASGHSALGVMAPVGIVILMWRMTDSLFGRADALWRGDRVRDAVFVYVEDPIVRLRLKWIFALCFIVGFASMLYLTRMTDFQLTLKGLKVLAVAWLSEWTIDAVVVFLVIAIVPLFILLAKTYRATDTTQPLGLVNAAAIIAVGFVSAFVLLKPDVITRIVDLSLAVDDRLCVLILLACCFDVILTAMVLMVDIRCRDFRELSCFSGQGLKMPIWVAFALGTLLPFVFAFACWLF